MDSSELALGGSSVVIALLSWSLNRTISKIDQEIEKLWGNTREIEESLQELAITITRLEALQSKHHK